MLIRRNKDNDVIVLVSRRRVAPACPLQKQHASDRATALGKTETCIGATKRFEEVFSAGRYLATDPRNVLVRVQNLAEERATHVMGSNGIDAEARRPLSGGTAMRQRQWRRAEGEECFRIRGVKSRPRHTTEQRASQ